jgi:hypothetical protein
MCELDQISAALDFQFTTWLKQLREKEKERQDQTLRGSKLRETRA